MTPPPRTDDVGPWAREKLRALGEYLDFYTTALKNQGQWKKIFIDAFAGPGLSRVRRSAAVPQEHRELFGSGEEGDKDEEEYLRGSPRVALDLDTPFDRYHFVERDSSRVQDLRALVGKYPARNIRVHEGDANEEIAALARRIDKKRHRAMVFIDPYGVNVHWATMLELARSGAVEVIINYPCMAINRLIARHGNIPDSWRNLLNDFFGMPEWEAVAYGERSDLFAQQRRERTEAAERQLLDFYMKNLKSAFGFVSQAKLVRNTKNAPLYYLVWAGPHPLGLKGADYILEDRDKRLPKSR